MIYFFLTLNQDDTGCFSIRYRSAANNGALRQAGALQGFYFLNEASLGHSWIFGSRASHGGNGLDPRLCVELARLVIEASTRNFELSIQLEVIRQQLASLIVGYITNSRITRATDRGELFEKAALGRHQGICVARSKGGKFQYAMRFAKIQTQIERTPHVLVSPTVRTSPIARLSSFVAGFQTMI